MKKLGEAVVNDLEKAYEKMMWKSLCVCSVVFPHKNKVFLWVEMVSTKKT